MSQLLSSDHLQLLRFRLHHQDYGLDVHNIQEIVPASEINKLPGASPFCIGVMTLRNKTIPCFDLSAALGFEPAILNQGQYLIVDDQKSRYALWVSGVEGIEQVDTENLKKPPKTLKTNALNGIVTCGDTLINYLNIKYLHEQLTSKTALTI